MGTGKYKTGRDVGITLRCGSAGEVCVCVYTEVSVCVCTICVLVCVDLRSPFYTLCLESDTGNKRLHICTCMSRITCSIELNVCPPSLTPPPSSSPPHPPIICLSLSVLFNLFLVSAQWLPLTVSPVTNVSFLLFCFLTLTTLKAPGPVWATWKHQ